jgi:glyoxylase-like metal-dependent hydrolase (beta-lactamase superfamily II)
MSDWAVEDHGRGLHLFRWRKGFYVSPFLVTSEGVVAFDPIDAGAAVAYRAAIETVTKAPVCAIVYSHDHRDHIVGAAELSKDAQVIAHRLVQPQLEKRLDPDIRPCTKLVDDGDELVFGDHRIEINYFGPNHSDSNLAVVLPSSAGRVLLFVDVVEPGVIPYRNLPDTDLQGLLHSLEAASRVECDLVLGGHTGPDTSEWVGRYRQYFADLLAATEIAFRAQGGQSPLEGEDGVAMTERVRTATCRAAAAELEGRYGHWIGFRQWAPLNADRVLSYLITGN